MQEKRLAGVIIKAIFIIVILLLAFFIIYGLFLKSRNINLDNKKVLVTIMENIKLGDSGARVEEIFNHHKTDTLQLKKLENEWLITMPYEFGATDWILWLGFENNKVTSLKIRLSDSKDMKPKESPPDKIKEVTASR